MMDAKLKQALIDKIQIVKEELKSPRAVKALLEKRARKTRTNMREKRAENALYEEVERKLRDRRLWKPIQDALAQQGFTIFLRNLETSQGAKAATKEISAARARQLALFPGFENLPVRIRIGSRFLKFPESSVSQFLTYESKYQAGAVRNQQTAEELRRLAEKVQCFAETDPDLALAEAFGRAEAQPARLSVVR